MRKISALHLSNWLGRACCRVDALWAVPLTAEESAANRAWIRGMRARVDAASVAREQRAAD